MPMRINGKNVVGLRHGGKNVTLARTGAKAAFSVGLRALTEEWASWVPGRWALRGDPAAETEVPLLEANPSRITAGTPGAMFSGKPAQSAYTLQDYANETGTWEAKCHTGGTQGGLYSGIILGGDAEAGRMLVVEWELNSLVMRYRTSINNAWVTISSNTSFRYGAGDTIRVTRTREGTAHRVRVYQNGVLRGNWIDTTGIPGAKGTRRIGVRLQADRNFFNGYRSPSIDRFTFTTATS